MLARRVDRALARNTTPTIGRVLGPRPGEIRLARVERHRTDARCLLVVNLLSLLLLELGHHVTRSASVQINHAVGMVLTVLNRERASVGTRNFRLAVVICHLPLLVKCELQRTLAGRGHKNTLLLLWVLGAQRMPSRRLLHCGVIIIELQLPVLLTDQLLRRMIH